MRLALALAFVLASSGCTKRSSDGYPVPVWDTVRVQVGTANVTSVDTRTTEPRLPTRSGRIAVRLTRPAENVPLAPDAFVNALRRWLEDHRGEVQARMGERCAGRDPCFEIVPWPSLAEGEPETGVPEAPEPAPTEPAPVPRRRRGRAAAPAPTPDPAPPAVEPTSTEAPPVDWIITAEVHEYEAYSGTLALHVRARSPSSEESALDGPIRAPDLATIAARIAGALLPGVEQVEVARQEPVYHDERRIVGFRRIPAR